MKKAIFIFLGITLVSAVANFQEIEDKFKGKKAVKLDSTSLDSAFQMQFKKQHGRNPTQKELTELVMNEGLIGRWKCPSDEGGYLEFLEEGKLISHMKFRPNSEDKTKADKIETDYPDIEISGSWKYTNLSVVLTFDLEDETIAETNLIVQIIDNSMIMKINGTNTTYTRIE
ncbi:hypothetical protein P4C99_20860 [Pontiellaceae bacterium B1224]|nr:hypothetical protein [Pontiellaceae bacterium B1224]